MFDLAKIVLGLSDCVGCKYRRWGGLVCGKRGPLAKFRPTPRGKYGCWRFAEDRPRLKED